MPYVTLVVDRRATSLSPALVETVRGAVGGDAPDILSSGEAADIRTASPPLLFGLRLWASVCLALYVAFWLKLDNPVWADTSAAIVCQPHLGASLRKAGTA